MTEQYVRGNGGVTLSAYQVSVLQGLYQSALADFKNNQEAVIGAPLYQQLIQDLSQEEVGPDGTMVRVPVSGLDPLVWSWINGALAVNTGSGFEAAFIRDYTEIQGKLRGDSGSLQSASNQIALGFVSDILSHNGGLPGIEGIGVIDAGSIASTLFEDASNSRQGEWSPWAGTILFPYLGEAKFYTDWLLTDGQFQAYLPDGALQTFKYVDGTYDLVSSLEATQEAIDQAAGSNLLGAGKSLLFDPEGAVQLNQTALIQETNKFFQQFYGLRSNSEFLPGADTIFGKNVFNLTSDNTYIVGSVDGELLNETNAWEPIPSPPDTLRKRGQIEIS